MKTTLAWIMLVTTLSFVVAPDVRAHGPSWGSDGGQPDVCDCRGGGGFPGPFDGSNLRVELSDGDLYALQGTVVFVSEGRGRTTEPYFQVDLREHPWLANSRRKSHPFYPLLGSVQFWRGLEGQEIELSAQAEGQPMIDSTGTATYDIALLPITVYLPHSLKR